ncbi:MAG TPA: DUF488 domain-containing protein [Methanosarcinaceae archaeon]|nr:DUF488 domain-containing protein [Methanosarcinaceae archaeon]
MNQNPKCYTIGYSNRPMDEFTGMLQKNNINYLVDIRRYPQSRREEFNRDALQDALPMYEIVYYHCPGVGGFRESTYPEYMQTGAFKESFSRLADKINNVSGLEGEIVLMCAEKSPKDCHRHYLSLELENEGVEIIHLTESGQTSLSCW